GAIYEDPRHTFLAVIVASRVGKLLLLTSIGRIAGVPQGDDVVRANNIDRIDSAVSRLRERGNGELSQKVGRPVVVVSQNINFDRAVCVVFNLIVVRLNTRVVDGI